jgi:hypothetical protein
MQAALSPFRLAWARVVQQDRTLHAITVLTVMVGLVVTEKKQELEQLSEVACLCDRCSAQPPPPGPGDQLGLKQELPPLS